MFVQVCLCGLFCLRCNSKLWGFLNKRSKLVEQVEPGGFMLPCPRLNCDELLLCCSSFYFFYFNFFFFSFAQLLVSMCLGLGFFSVFVEIRWQEGLSQQAVHRQEPVDLLSPCIYSFRYLLSPCTTAALVTPARLNHTLHFADSQDAIWRIHFQLMLQYYTVFKWKQ